MSRAFIPTIADQVADTIPTLWRLRSIAARSMNYCLADLAELDDRIEANLDVLRTMGRAAQRRCAATLSLDCAGEVFMATLFALEARDAAGIRNLCAIAEAMPATREGLHDAFCWIYPQFLRGTVKSLLESSSPFERSVGITASAAHGFDPGQPLMDGLRADDPDLRAAALRAAGELGVANAVSFLNGGDDECRFWASRSAALLGERGAAIEALTRTGLTVGAPHRSQALRLALQSKSSAAAHGCLRELAQAGGQLRRLIQGSGITGNPTFVPWLIGHMADDETARVAAEAFTLITGVDLGRTGLEGQRGKHLQAGPNEDDPNDPDVMMDKDGGSSWPDAERVKAWWTANGNRYQRDTRYFMGAPVTATHCSEVLRTGYQRQRILAAHYLSLLEPGRPLFNTNAPAWRQQECLARLA